MAEIDKAKEDISYRKFWLGISIAVFLSIASWIVNSYDKSSILIFLASLVECLLMVVIYLTHKNIILKIKELKDK
ncbi:MAG: hypothetical protein CSA86_06040 [Arcobacter sp.]|nr:MAG: hypothetical protein CSA86_06040 [Arcobacter sp.]